MNTTALSTALKTVFGNNTTDNPSSSSKIPYCGSDGLPAGLASMSNLASVLGVNFGYSTVHALAAAINTDQTATSSNRTSGEEFQLIQINNAMMLILAYDIEDPTKYCGAVVISGTQSDNSRIRIVAKYENGMTITGKEWGYVSFTSESNHHIQLLSRYLLS